MSPKDMTFISMKEVRSQNSDRELNAITPPDVLMERRRNRGLNIALIV